jgi:hypothetical protein
MCSVALNQQYEQIEDLIKFSALRLRFDDAQRACDSRVCANCVREINARSDTWKLASGRVAGAMPDLEH